MYNKVYEKKEFIIFQVKNGYIAYNTKKAFKDGHTHMKCFKSAKTVIDLVIRKKVPRSTDLYYLTSLIRLSEDLFYINKIEELIKYYIWGSTALVIFIALCRTIFKSE